MLVLSRQTGESIRIGNDITVTVVRSGSTVQLGIEAPRAVDVWRSELYRFHDIHGKPEDTSHVE